MTSRAQALPGDGLCDRLCLGTDCATGSACPIFSAAEPPTQRVPRQSLGTRSLERNSALRDSPPFPGRHLGHHTGRRLPCCTLIEPLRLDQESRHSAQRLIVRLHASIGPRTVDAIVPGHITPCMLLRRSQRHATTDALLNHASHLRGKIIRASRFSFVGRVTSQGALHRPMGHTCRERGCRSGGDKRTRSPDGGSGG